jgi:parvulin-like peptidyl-prolyl isomerase
MARQKQQLRPTKKHLARAERERILKNRIIAGTVITAILVFGLIGYGIYREAVLLPGEPIAIVNGEEIITRDFQHRVISEVAYSGESADSIALNILDTMIKEVLVRQEAEKMGIAIPEEELDQRIEEYLGYYRNGTPTSLPSITPDPTRRAERTLTAAAVTASPSPTAEVSPTTASTPTPRPTPTEYTEQGYEQAYADFISSLEERSGFSEEQVRQLFLTNMLSEKIREVLEQSVPSEGEKTQLRHILADSEETAQEVRTKLEEGEAWEDLVTEYSQDATTKDAGGELGWLTNEIILAGFGPSAESLSTEPVGTLVGPIQTYQGWHVFEIMDRDTQTFTDYEYQQAVSSAYSDWLSIVQSNADIMVIENWEDRIPEVEVPESGYYY